MAQVMEWVKRLPEVGDRVLNERARIEDTVQRAANLVAEAERLRAQAYRDAQALERTIRANWPQDQVDRLKNQ